MSPKNPVVLFLLLVVFHGAANARPLDQHMIIPPFQNRTGDAGLDWLSVGLQDALTTQLWKLQGWNAFALPAMASELVRLCPDWTLACVARLDEAQHGEVAGALRAELLVLGRYTKQGEAVVVEMMMVRGRDPEPISMVRVLLDPVSSLPLADALIDLLVGAGIPVSDDSEARMGRGLTQDQRAWRANAMGFWMQQKYALSEPGAEQEGVVQTWLEYLRESVGFDPNYAGAWNNLGWAYLVVEEQEDSARALKRARDADAEFLDALIGQGVLAVQSGDLASALAPLRRAYTLNPMLEQHLEYLTLAYVESGKPAEGLAFLAPHVERVRGATNLFERVRVLSRYGDLLRADGRPSEALDVYRAARSAAEAGEWPDAVDSLEALMAVASVEQAAKLLESDALFGDEDAVAALEDAARVLRPTQPAMAAEALNLLASGWAKMGAWQRAADAYKETVALLDSQMAPTDERLLGILIKHAEACERAGRLDEAEDAMRKVVANLEPLRHAQVIPTQTMTLGRIQARSGRYGDASATLRDALRLIGSLQPADETGALLNEAYVRDWLAFALSADHRPMAATQVIEEILPRLEALQSKRQDPAFRDRMSQIPQTIYSSSEPAWAYLRLGWYALDAGSTESAVGWFERANGSDTLPGLRLPIGSAGLAVAYQDLGRPNEALRVLENALAEGSWASIDLLVGSEDVSNGFRIEQRRFGERVSVACDSALAQAGLERDEALRSGLMCARIAMGARPEEGALARYSRLIDDARSVGDTSATNRMRRAKADALLDLATALEQTDHSTDTRAYREEAYAIMEELDPSDAYVALKSDASRLYARGETKQAVEIMQRAVDLGLAGHAKGISWATGDDIGFFVLMLGTLGDNPRALKALEQQIELIRTTELPDSMPDGMATYTEINALRSLVSIHQEMGRFQQALDAQDRMKALEVELQGTGWSSANMTDLDDLGRVQLLVGLGHWDEARLLGETLLGRLEADVEDADKMELAISLLFHLTNLCEAMADFPCALDYSAKAIRYVEIRHPGLHWRRLSAEVSAIAVSTEMGDLLKARERLRSLVDTYSEVLAEDAPGFGVAINNLAVLEQRLGAFDRAKELFEGQLGALRKTYAETHKAVLTMRGNLAALHEAMGDLHAARDMAASAVEDARLVYSDAQSDLASLIKILGGIEFSLGNYQEAESLLGEAREIFLRADGERSRSYLLCLGDQVAILEKRGDYFQAQAVAEDIVARAADLFGEGHPDYAQALRTLAVRHIGVGAFTKAEPLLKQALQIDQSVFGSNSAQTAHSLNALGTLEASRSRYAEAIGYYERGKALVEAAWGTGHDEYASFLNNLGFVFDALGQTQTARANYEESLKVSIAIYGEESHETKTAINNLAFIAMKEKDYAEAEKLFLQALEIGRRYYGGDHPETALVQLNLARLYREMGRLGEAESMALQALATYRSARGEGHDQVAKTLSQLARLEIESGDLEAARNHAIESTLSAAATEAPEALSGTLMTLSRVLAAQGEPGLAILVGKRAINLLQEVRAGLTRLNRSLREGFGERKAEEYRFLAELLIAEGRLPEAQQVLRMLKEAEFFDFIRREAEDDPRQSLSQLDPFEEAQQARLDAPAGVLAGLGAELADLRRLKAPTDAEQARIAELEARLRTAAADFETALEAIETAFAERAESLERQRYAELDRRIAQAGNELTDLLAALETTTGQRVALLQYLVLPERLHILLTVGRASIAVPVDLAESDLNRMVQDYRAQIGTPAGAGEDPMPLAQRLHATLIQPIAADLEAAGVEMLMVYLDGALRYLPLAALHDGNGWLVERYGLAIYTAVQDHNLEDAPSPDWRLAGFGVSAAHADVGPTRRGFGALPAVPAELEGIVRRSADDPDGSLPGRIWLDPDFTAEALIEVLDQGEHPVLHLATHFALGSGDHDSFLLLGDGQALTLSALRRHRFRGVDLVALSACDTAVSLGGHAGREIEGLGTLVQQKGAKGVIASLWPVADASTRELMEQLYRLRQEQGLTKAEALRAAQLALLKAEPGSGACGDARGPLMVSGRDQPSAPSDDAAACRWSHPYFWAPFILMGNWL